MSPRERKSDCSIHAGLSVFGDAWTLLVIRELFRGHNTFTEISNAEEGIATNVLADRLVRLEEDGIITKENLPGRGNPTRYELTQKGLELLPILIAISDWSVKHDPATHANRDVVRIRKRHLVKAAASIRARLRKKALQKETHK